MKKQQVYFQKLTRITECVAEDSPLYGIKLSRVSDATDLKPILATIWDKDQIGIIEQMYALYFNHRAQLVSYALIGQGGITGTVADQRIIFSHALMCGATRVVIAHNHPSGSLIPSNADRELTKKTKDAGELLGITLIDSVIVTEGFQECYSVLQSMKF